MSWPLTDLASALKCCLISAQTFWYVKLLTVKAKEKCLVVRRRTLSWKSGRLRKATNLLHWYYFRISTDKKRAEQSHQFPSEGRSCDAVQDPVDGRVDWNPQVVDGVHSLHCVPVWFSIAELHHPKAVRDALASQKGQECEADGQQHPGDFILFPFRVGDSLLCWREDIRSCLHAFFHRPDDTW